MLRTGMAAGGRRSAGPNTLRAALLAGTALTAVRGAHRFRSAMLSTTAIVGVSTALLVGFGAGHARAQQVYTGTTNTDWNTATNWFPNNVPDTSAETAVFQGTTAPSTANFSANTNTGGVTFDAGAQSYTINSGNFVSGFNGAIVNNSGAVQTFVANGGINTGFLFSTNTGVTTLQSTTGTLQFQTGSDASGSRVIDDGRVIILRAANSTLNMDSLEGAGSVIFSTNTNQTLSVGNANDTTFSGNINDGIIGTGGLTKVGTGTLTLSGNSSYSLATNVNVGVLNIQSATALGSTATGTTVASGAALELQGGIAVGAEALSLAGTGIGNTGALRNISGNNSYAGAVTLTAASEIQSDAGTLTLSGGITGAGQDLRLDGQGNGVVSGVIGTDAGTVTKGGTGTWTLSGPNTYTGVTSVDNGTLNIQNATALGTAAGGTTVASGAALELQGGIAVGAEALSIAGSGVGGNGALRNVSGNNSFAGAITLTAASEIQSDAGTLTLSGGITGAGQNLTLDGAGNGVESGVIGTTTGTVTKTGAGTWTLSGANTYTGTTTVSDGALNVTGAGSLASTVVAVSGGTLTTDSNAFAGGAAVTVSGGTFTATGTDSITSVNQSAGTINGSAVLTLTGAFAQSGGTTGGTVDINAATFTQSGGATIAAGTTVTSAGAQSLQGGTIAGTLDGAGAITVTTGTTSLTGSITNAASLTASSGTLSATGAGTIGTNTVTVSGGTLTTDGGALAAGATVTVSSGTLTATGEESIAGLILSGGTVNGAGPITSTTDFDVRSGTASAVLAGAVGLTKTTVGMVTLSGANTYTGATTVSAGILNIQSASALGTTAGGTTVASGATLQIENGITVGAEPVGTGVGGNGALQNVSGANAYGGAITLAADARIQSDAGSLTLSGGIDGDAAGRALALGGAGNGTVSGAIGANVGGLTKEGAGTWTLSGANSYTGGTTISAGTLALSGSGSIATSSGVALATGATFDISGHTGGASIKGLSNTVSGQTGAVTLGANTLTLSNASGAYAGTIAGTGGVTLAGGSQTLSGSSTYTGGTTVSGGTLSVSSDANLGAASGGLTFAGGTLETTASFTSARGVTLDTAGTIETDANVATTLSGVIADGGGAGSLTKTGSGTLILSGANTYTGATTVSAGTLKAGAAGALSAGSATSIATGSTLDLGGTAQTVDASALNGGTLTNGSLTGAVTSTGGTVNALAGSATLTTTAGTTTLTGANSYTGATTISAGTLAAGAANTLSAGSATSIAIGGTLDLGGVAQTVDAIALNGGTLTNGSLTGAVTSTGGTVNALTGSATLTTTAGTTTLTGTNAYTGATTVTGGTLAVAAGASVTSPITNNATFNTDGTISGGLVNTGTVNANGGAIDGGVDNSAGTFLIGGTVTGDGTFANASGATLAVGGTGDYTLQGRLTNSGAVTVAGGGRLTATVGGIANLAGGTIEVAAGGTLADDLDNASAVTNNGAYFADVASNTGAGLITNTATGTWTGDVLGNDATIVNAGTWVGDASSAGTLLNAGTWTGAITNAGDFTNAVGATVSGLLTNTAGTTRNDGALNGGVLIIGGRLIGSGSVSDLTVGGVFAPGDGTAGSSMRVNGNLTLLPGATYAVAIDPATASFADVMGMASLGGATVNATYAPGAYISRRYTILDAAGGIGGTFGALVDTNLPPNFISSLSYDPTHAYLDLALNFTPPSAGPDFGNGLNLNQRRLADQLAASFDRNGGIPLAYGALTPQGLTAVSGELGAASQQAAFDATTGFLGLLADPLAAGRSEAGERTVTTWAAALGSSRTTDGDVATGSAAARTSVSGFAAGLDYRMRPDTVVGFGISGGRTQFDLDGGLGSGDADLLQAGLFLRQAIGPAYVTAAFAYGRQEVTTDRTLALAGIDTLRGRFDADTWSGRLEAGYHLDTAGDALGIGVELTPFIAGQFVNYAFPGYDEQVVSGQNTFVLNYASKDVTSTRSEIGIRANVSLDLDDALLTLGGKAAWAHDFEPNRSVTATLQGLPDVSFVVDSAAQSRDAALLSASAELKWQNGWSAAASFDGEFSKASQSYGGKALLRYAW